MEAGIRFFPVLYLEKLRLRDMKPAAQDHRAGSQGSPEVWGRSGLILQHAAWLGVEAGSACPAGTPHPGQLCPSMVPWATSKVGGFI